MEQARELRKITEYAQELGTGTGAPQSHRMTDCLVGAGRPSCPPPGASPRGVSAAGYLVLQQSQSGSPKWFKLLPLLIVLEIDLLDVHSSSF